MGSRIALERKSERVFAKRRRRVQGGDIHSLLESKLLKLPCQLVIDHLGQLAQPGGVASEGFAALSRLLATGRVWTKMSAPYNTSKSGAPEYADFGQVAAALVNSDPTG